jgi:DNA-binding transcriptional MerR regulator
MTEDDRLMAIGALAAAAGVSTRTVRYYEQRGLLSPAGHSVGGARRYDADCLERLQRIRELAEILGSDLDEIAHILAAEDRLTALKRARAKAGPNESPDVLLGRLQVAQEINDDLRARMSDRVARLSLLLAECDARDERYAARRQEIAAIPIP